MGSRTIRVASILWVAVLLLAPPPTQAESSASEAEATYAEIRAALGTVPSFLRSFPAGAVAGAWEELKSVQFSSETILPGKYKELIGLAVAAQIPCSYCVYAHAEGARLNGATDDELREAIALSALTRHWSTFLNGAALDMAEFRKDVDGIFAHFEDAAASQAMDPMVVTDAASAREDIQRTFGSVPGFVKAVPDSALPGAWKELKALELNPHTSIPPKYKSLLTLAVAAQIPCSYCVYFDTRGARAEGATEQEIGEAIAMAALTRHWSTVLNGSQIELEAFRKEIDQVFRFSQQQHADSETSGSE